MLIYSLQDKLNNKRKLTESSADKIIDIINDDLTLFDESVKLLFSENPIIRKKSFSLVSKILETEPGRLNRFKILFFERGLKSQTEDSKMYIAQLFRFFYLIPAEQKIASEVLVGWYQSTDNSKFKAEILETLAFFAKTNPYIKRKLHTMLDEIVKRGNKLLRQKRKKLNEFLGF